MEATMNTLNKFLIASLLAGSFGSLAAPALADTVIIREAPPAPRAERVPPPRRGYVWAPGHWEYRHGHYVWTAGTWLRERRGYAYSAPTWVERNGHWEMERGGWRRGDRDGDGVPNRVDAHPNNPNRG
jgi:WXXGXW repeat (2 copies)